MMSVTFHKHKITHMKLNL